MSRDALYEKLIDAVQYGDEEFVIKHVEADASLLEDCTDWVGDRLLSLCIWHGRLKLAKSLIKMGADVDARNRAGGTAMHRAAHKGDIDGLSILIDAGGDMFAKDKRHCRPQDIGDEGTRTLIKATHEIRILKREQQELEAERKRRASLYVERLEAPETKLTFKRRRQAVPVIIRGHRHDRINGCYEPTEHDHCCWPVYSKRRDRECWLLCTGEAWVVKILSNVEDISAIEASANWLSVPSDPADFPELTPISRASVIELTPGYIMNSSFLGNSEVEIQSEMEIQATKTNATIKNHERRESMRKSIFNEEAIREAAEEASSFGPDLLEAEETSNTPFSG